MRSVQSWVQPYDLSTRLWRVASGGRRLKQGTPSGENAGVATARAARGYAAGCCSFVLLKMYELVFTPQDTSGLKSVPFPSWSRDVKRMVFFWTLQGLRLVCTKVHASVGMVCFRDGRVPLASRWQSSKRGPTSWQEAIALDHSAAPSVSHLFDRRCLPLLVTRSY